MNTREVIIKYLKESDKKSFSMEELSIALHLNKSEDFKLFVKIIASLESDKLVNLSEKGKISLVQEKKVVPLVDGIFRANASGFGFVAVEGEDEDLFIPKGKTNFALEADEVVVEITKNASQLRGNSAEGKIVEVKARALRQVVGKFTSSTQEQFDETGFIGYVKSRNKKVSHLIFLTGNGLKPENGMLVRAEITRYPDREFPESMQGLATEIIGKETDKGIDVLEVLAGMDIHSDFSDEVMAEANSVADEVSEKDLIGRVDYRNEIVFTIDGADAKDLDDAVHIKELANGNYELGVHIADVSYYVTEGSHLNAEAYERGTSVYVTDRVVPMLPERLSNGICSLNPRVNRLTQSCVMEIDKQGKVINYQISQSVIKTVERMTYDDVNLIIARDEAAVEKYHAIVDSVDKMVLVHGILEQMRGRRGAINFDTIEAKIIVDETGAPVEIKKRSRGIAERMIESFMLIANETVASYFEEKNLPFIYRIHEQPKADRLTRFIDFAASFGVAVKGSANSIDQKDLQDFLNSVKGKPGELVLSTMLLRSMQQARYSENNHGHFGLAAENYTHFTSPIRRYPDLLVHRLIRVMDHVSNENRQKWEDAIPEMAQHSSQRERRAVDAEREVEKMKKAEFMEDKVGEEFEGVISSVTRFGLFVELENTVEGLIHVSRIKQDYMTFHERSLAMVGERTGLVFKIGQAIKISVLKADRITGEIDFTYLPSELDLKDLALAETAKKENQNKKGPRDNRRKPKASNKEDKTKQGAAPKSSKPKVEKPAKNGKAAKPTNHKKLADKKDSPFYEKAAKGKFTRPSKTRARKNRAKKES